MKLINTKDPQYKPSLVMMVYGEGGVGKTTFTSTAPTPVLADCENGAKYFGLRGIEMDVAQIEKWSDMRDFLELVKGGKYETVIIDPIGELMDKLKKFMVATGDSKNVQKDGSLTMAGWGNLKKNFKDYLKILRDSGKHVILIAHIEEKDDEGRLVKRPKIETKIADDIVNMVDVVGYMTVVQQEGESKRIIIVDPGNDKFTAKDRTGQLGKIIEPDFTKIVNACQGTKTYSWSKVQEVKAETKKEVKEEKAVPEKPVETVQPKPEKKLSNPHLQAAKEKLAKASK
jgi:phage nucleotide-binding protein